LVTPKVGAKQELLFNKPALSNSDLWPFYMCKQKVLICSLAQCHIFILLRPLIKLF